MADLWLLALGFGLLPLAAAALAIAPRSLREHGDVAWGLLIGIVAFLGLAHAGATILEGDTFLRFEASPEASAATAAAGLLLGIALGWLALGRHTPTGPSLNVVAYAAAVYVALHSVADGLVLGEGYTGPLAPGYPLTLATVGGTVVHRFAEGALIAVPALLAAAKPSRWTFLLLAGLLTVPAAFLPVAILGAAPSAGAVALDQAIGVFAAGLEAGFAALFLLLGLLPQVVAAKSRSWAVWAGLAFTAIVLVHFLVE